jgi:hypothetical protein
MLGLTRGLPRFYATIGFTDWMHRDFQAIRAYAESRFSHESGIEPP